MTIVTLQTNLGNVDIELDHENTPNTAANFLTYAKAGFYDGTIFHRVIDGFMIQAGGHTPDMQEKSTNEPINNEADQAKKNTRGTVAMARTSDPHSATAQFFINVADNHFLNHSAKTPDGWGYCVFGKVTKGMDIVDQIKQQKTTSRSGHADVPVNDIVIEKVTVV